MREIKFRAYHRTLGKMLNVYVIDQSLYEGMTYMERCKGWYGENNQVTFAFDQVNWMQFTGLHDKHGTEIYEGDIVEDGGVDRDMNRTLAIVRFGDYHLSHPERVVTLTEHRGFWLEGLKPKKLRKESIHKTEVVVGNIYENPELLEESKHD